MNETVEFFIYVFNMFWLIAFTRTLFLFKVTCLELRYLRHYVLRQQVFVVLNSHKSSLFLFDLVNCTDVRFLSFNMPSDADCAVASPMSGSGGLLLTKSVYTGVSE